MLTSHSAARVRALVVTPYKADAWDDFLARYSLTMKYPNLSNSIRLGFRAGYPPDFISSFTPPNMPSALEHPEVLDAYILEELEAGRVSGPFTKSQIELILGPFRSCPLGLVPKAGDALKWRIVRNLSKRDRDGISVNDLLDPDLLPTTWGSAALAAELVATAPIGSQAATSDIAKAYRTIPVHPEHKRLIVFGHRDHFFVDHCLPFGLSPAAGMQGEVADAMADILIACNIPTVKWVDDALHRRSPCGINADGSYLYSYNLSDIRVLLEPLGIPWNMEKSTDFADTAKYVGFLWDFKLKRVALPDEKRVKYLRKVDEFLQRGAVTLKEVTSMVGSLSHISFIFREGRAYLPGLSRFETTFNMRRSLQTRHPPPSVLSDLRWWRDLLQQPGGSRSLTPRGPAVDLGVWVDASTDFGIGIIVSGTWAAWRLRHNWKTDGRDIGWAEAVALELALRALHEQGLRDIDLIVHGDNTGAIGAFARGRGRNPNTNNVLRRMHFISRECNIIIVPIYVVSEENLADPISRGTFAGKTVPSSLSIPLPAELQPFLERV